MELWIRSQNKKMLTKLDYCYLEPVHKREILGGNHYLINQSLGIYPTEKRALEVLDEIQKKLNCNKYLLHAHPLISRTDLEDAKIYFEQLNKIDLIADDGCFKIEPVGNQILIYEMPKK